MKVMQINCVYNKGSTGKITRDIHHGLQQAGIESVVCYGRGAKVDEPNVYKTCSEWYAKLNNLFSRFTGIMYGGCFFSTNRLISIIKKEAPDVVHLQCINGYFVNIYRLIRWLKENHVKTVLTLHAEFMYTANCGCALDCERWKTGCGHCPRRRKETKSLFWDGTARSWRRMKKAFDGFKDLVVVSVSPWLEQRARWSGILANKNHQVVFNGIDTEIFRAKDTCELRQQLGLGTKKVVFHVTAAFSDQPGHLKGGAFVLELARRMKDEPLVFIVAGRCILQGEIPENVILLGEVQDQELLARCYSLADVTLLTSKKETFSMPCAESLCCGTPVVGFEAGGPESICLQEHSTFVRWGDVEALQCALAERLHEGLDHQCERICDDAVKAYSKERMTEQYLDLYWRMA